MQRISIHSRLGNIALAVVGAAYVIAAVGLCIFYVVTTWSAARFIDHILQFALFIAALVGIYFIELAMPKLRAR